MARTLGLPATTAGLRRVCHGTMTGWFNHNFQGFALTVEYGAHPPGRLMQVAPRAAAHGASRDRVDASSPTG